MECSWRLWPIPGMYAVISMPVVNRTRATFRSAEFGFLGVVVNTRVHTPRRWGDPRSAGVLDFSVLLSRPLRTSWAIVGTTLPGALRGAAVAKLGLGQEGPRWGGRLALEHPERVVRIRGGTEPTSEVTQAPPRAASLYSPVAAAPGLTMSSSAVSDGDSATTSGTSFSAWMTASVASSGVAASAGGRFSRTASATAAGVGASGAGGPAGGAASSPGWATSDAPRRPARAGGASESLGEKGGGG